MVTVYEIPPPPCNHGKIQNKITTPTFVDSTTSSWLLPQTIAVGYQPLEQIVQYQDQDHCHVIC